MKILKACILAAGEGKRLAPLTETRPKPLIPIAGKPLLQHTIEMLRDNGVSKILLIIGYLKEQIIDFFGNGEKYDVEISYIEQKEFLGTGNATNLAKDFVGQDPFLLIYGDLFMDAEIFSKSINEFSLNQYSGIITAKSMPDPSKWGILQINSDGFLEKLIEKPPDDRYGNLANAGVYIFNSEIFEGIANTEKSIRGEYELTDSIQYLVDKKKNYKILDISKFFWSDVGYPWQLLEATHHVLSKLPGEPTAKNFYPPPKIINNGATIENFVTIHGTIVIGKDSLIKAGTYIEGPLIIGDGCVIGPNAYLRPYTAIGDNCKIGNSSEIKASIIMSHTAIPHLSYVGDSIIGEHVNLGCGTVTANVRLDKQNILMEIKDKIIKTHKRKIGTVIGDNSSLGINVNIMPGKTIGSYCQIGSNTIVSRNIPANSLLYSEQIQNTKTILKKIK